MFIRINIRSFSAFSLVRYFVESVTVNFGVGRICFVVNESTFETSLITMSIIRCSRFRTIIIVLSL